MSISSIAELPNLTLGFFGSLFFSFTLCHLLVRLALAKDYLDKPDGVRKLQNQSTPFLGGIALFMSSLIASSVSIIVFEFNQVNQILYGVFLPATLVFLVGLIDDFLNLTPKRKLFGQTLSAIAASYFLEVQGFGVQVTENSLVNFTLTSLWLIIITNSFNLLDNHDLGLSSAATPTLIALSILALAYGQVLVLGFSVVLLGSLLGFSILNKPPAKIYLGDSGSLFLGFCVALLSLRLRPEVDSLIISLVIPILLVALFILDTSLVVIDRLSKKRSIFVGGRDHISHRLISFGFNRKLIPIAYISISAVFLFLLYLTINSSIGLAIPLLVVSAAIFFSLLLFLLKLRSYTER